MYRAWRGGSYRSVAREADPWGTVEHASIIKDSYQPGKERDQTINGNADRMRHREEETQRKDTLSQRSRNDGYDTASQGESVTRSMFF